MPGSLAELYGALLKQEPQGILGAARFNPLMMAKALRQQQANPRPSLASLMNYPQTWQQFGDNIQANYPIDSPAAVRQAAFDAAKNAGPLMTVWQGSPHRFAPTKNNPLGEFDATKIGSGEGAQAYGYGHYLAEAPDVAKSYKPKTGLPEWNGKQVQQYGFDGSVTFADGTVGKVADKDWAAFRSAMESGPRGGHLYKVDLPDDQIAKMLDWDKPLSQQPEAVREGVRSALQQNGIAKSVADYIVSNKTGMEALSTLSRGAYAPNLMPASGEAAAKASDLLRQSGITGIRYLDAGSRGAGTGTSNFVVFPGNENALKILARE